MERTKAEKLADKLDGMVRAKVLPGLLPEDVAAAAEMLRAQEAELKMLRAALATKRHVVNVSISKQQPYSKTVRGEFIIADPRIYYGEMRVDDQAAYMTRDQGAWQMHVARQLVRSATADWMRELEERCYVGLRAALTSVGLRRNDEHAVAATGGETPNPSSTNPGADNGCS